MENRLSSQKGNQTNQQKSSFNPNSERNGPFEQYGSPTKQAKLVRLYEHIDWIAQTDQRSESPVTAFFPVKRNPVIYRGSLSPRECLIESVAAWTIEQDIQTATRWLMAAQAHNPEAQMLIVKNAKSALMYLLPKLRQYKIDINDIQSRAQKINTPENLLKGVDNFTQNSKQQGKVTFATFDIVSEEEAISA